MPKPGHLVASALAAFLALAAASAASAAADPRIAPRVMQLDRAIKWVPVAATRLRFRTFHPQGMVRIGANFYLSSVEIIAKPKKYAVPHAGHDRDTGAGIGHLFKISPNGALLADLILGEGSIYHPGGIDFDGSSIWVPVSEYRPNSRAIVYRVDPEAMTAAEVFRFDDHIGGIVHDPDRHMLHGLSWGSRRFYDWPLDAGGKPGAATVVPNPSHYIDYQDCHLVGAARMLCDGLGEYKTAAAAPAFQLGGIELVDLDAHRPLWQLPVELWAPSGRAMTQNPFFVESTETGLRAWFIPDDDISTLYVFDVGLP